MSNWRLIQLFVYDATAEGGVVGRFKGAWGMCQMRNHGRLMKGPNSKGSFALKGPGERVKEAMPAYIITKDVQE